MPDWEWLDTPDTEFIDTQDTEWLDSNPQSVCWGHDTAVEEDTTRDLSTWAGTATASGAGDAEIITFDEGEDMTSPVWNLGAGTAVIELNKYAAADTLDIEYKTGSSEVTCNADSWHAYTVPFATLGYVRIKLSYP